MLLSIDLFSDADIAVDHFLFIQNISY